MTDLITLDEAREFLTISDTADDSLIAALVLAASASARNYCGRDFEVDATQSATARYFTPESCFSAKIDDCWSITAVATDDADDGTWSTSWASTDWYAMSADKASGQSPYGGSGWPYTHLHAVESREFPYVARPALKVTAKWGWTALPSAVNLAVKMLVNEAYKARDGGYDTFTTDGGFTIIRGNRVVRDLLAPYRRGAAGDGRFVIG